MGYIPANNQWQFRIALNNTGGDVISVISPADRANAFFSIGYGYAILPGFRNPSLSMVNVAAGNNAWLWDSNYLNAASWNISPVAANETPGSPNGNLNTNWILSMRKVDSALLPQTSFNVCLAQSQSYNFNGQILSVAGHYNTTFIRPGQCDSLVHLYLVVSSTQTQTLTACDSIIFNGTTYTSSIQVRDTIKSLVSNCDSIIRVNNIIINPVKHSFITQCLATGQTFFFNGQSLAASGNYLDTQTTITGCDSIIHLQLVVSSTQTQTISGCGAVQYNGTTYTSSTVLKQIIPSVFAACDSIISTVNIIVNTNPILSISGDSSICKGDSATLAASANGSTVEWIGIGFSDSITVSPAANTVYTAIAANNNGCTDTASVVVTVTDFNLNLFANPNPAIAGTGVLLQTTASANYTILSWNPSVLFPGQTAIRQFFIADSSINVFVMAISSGCTDSDSVYIIVDPLNDIYIPTAFTPNRDGKNDFFTIGGGSIIKTDLKIFNRWGQMIFSSNSRSRVWDGTFAGKQQPPGAYIYNLNVILKDGNIVRKKGTVLLIR